jgi:RNA polymerase sigma-70 factor (ECF subfamily)
MEDQSFDFETALIKLVPQMRAFARSLVGQDGDDLVQDTLLRAIKSRHTFVPGTNLKAWLFTILRNQWVTAGRRKRAEVGLAEDFDAPAEPTQEHAVALSEFTRLLDRLPERQREALLLVAANGFSYEEAAAISGTTAGTVKSRVSRARAFLAPLFIAATPLGVTPISDRAPAAVRRTRRAPAPRRPDAPAIAPDEAAAPVQAAPTGPRSAAAPI